MMNFSDALLQLKAGAALLRKGWNKPHTTLTGSDWSCPREGLTLEDSKFWLKTSGVKIRWFATDADLLADDWEII